jgi:site-specific DNA-methyltransferase (adenine-specific)
MDKSFALTEDISICCQHRELFMRDMEEFYSDSAVTLYQGDAWQVLRSLPPDSVDAVITDPPYSTGAVTLAGKQAAPAIKYQQTGTIKQYPEMLGDGKDQRSFLAWAVMWLTEAWRVSRPGAPVLIFTDWRQLPTVTDALQAAGFLWRGIVVWHKTVGEFRACFQNLDKF